VNLRIDFGRPMFVFDHFGRPKSLEQARQYMFEVMKLIQSDGMLLHPPGQAFQGKCRLGTALSSLTSPESSSRRRIYVKSFLKTVVYSKTR
jgi:hypothetical protein